MSKNRRYGESPTPPYRGGDRRGAITADRPSPGWPVAAATTAVLTVWAVFALGPQAAPRAGLINDVLLELQLDAVTAVVGIVVGVLCLLRWRLVGDAAALWFGAAALLFGTVTVGSGPLLPLVRPEPLDAEMLHWLPPASRVVVLGLLWRAARTPQVDTSLRLGRVLAGTLIATVCAVGVVAVAPGLARFVASGRDVLPGVEPVAGAALAVTLAWLVLAGLHAHRGSRQRHWLHLWFGIALLALGLGEVLWLVAPADGALWAAGPTILRTAGMLSALTGATGELGRAFAEQRGQLFETIATGLTAEARVRAEQAAAQERAHEARNALTAIEGATRTLEVYRDRLDAQTQASLSQAITTEIARLQRLVSPEQTHGRSFEFPIADTLVGVVVGARTQGIEIEMRVPDDLSACGRPGELAEVVQNLIENARRYAPGSPVVVRAERDRTGVLIRVEDRGPGVPADERERIFARGYRGREANAAGGSGLGLYICARLMHEQQGDLWVDERPGGGASFAAWLPAHPVTSQGGLGEPLAGQAAPDEGEHVVETGNVYPIFRTVDSDPHGGQALDGERDHGLGNDMGG